MSKFFSRPAKPAGSLPSALYLLEWAGLLVAIFCVAHLAGLRDFTSVLNGTVGSTSMNWQTAAFLGVAYVLIYLGVVLMVPILAIAALILTLWNKLLANKVPIDEPRNDTQKN